jgi:hypothetical protein
MDIRRRWKSLIHKVEYLRLEVEDHDEVLKEFEVAFVAALMKAAGVSDPMTDQASEVAAGVSVIVEDPNDPCPEPSASKTVEDVSEELPSAASIDESSRPEAMKKLWKAVAMATHPDRTGGDERLTQLYKKASNAWNLGLFEDLLDVALEVHVDLPDPDPTMLVALTARAKTLSSRVIAAEASVLWMWGNAPDEKKDSVMQMYLNMRKKKRTVVSPI